MQLSYRLSIAVVAVLLSAVAVSSWNDIKQNHANNADQGPCDIFEKGQTPCVAAHSVVRALFQNYSGPLYTVRRRSDNATFNVSTLGAGGFADTPGQDAFCKQRM